MNITTQQPTRPLRRFTRWALLGLGLLLLVAVISGCSGGKSTPPLNDKQFGELGTEMLAIEHLQPAQLAGLQDMTPMQVEFIGNLSPAQLAHIETLTADEVRNVPLGKTSAVVAKLLQSDPGRLDLIPRLSRDAAKAVEKRTQGQLLLIAKMTPAQYKRLGKLSPEELDRIEGQQLNTEAPNINEQNMRGYALFWQGYLAEAGAIITDEASNYLQAQSSYEQAITTVSAYTNDARYRLGVLDANHVLTSPQPNKIAKTQLQPLTRDFTTRIWVRQPALAAQDGAAVLATKKNVDGKAVLFPEIASTAATSALDTIYRTGGGTDQIYYNAVHKFVTFFTLISPSYGAAIALIMLALVIKLITTPLTTASFRGMRDMQRVQPLIKELQEKYKDDKQKLAEEQMKLMKEHKVSPLGGCLPMLIQLPIFFIVYRAVQVYAAGFADSQFLWINNLARPDMVLLVLYAISMIVTQKLTAAPATDPQQQMMQKQMTYIMPVMLYFFLQAIASAFVLYWFFLNVFSAAHQYYLVNKFKQEDAAMGVTTPATEPSTGPKKRKKS